MASSPETVSVLVDDFVRLYPDEAARTLESLPPGDTVGLLEATPSQAAAILPRLTPDTAVQLLAQMTEGVAGQVLSAIDSSRAAALVARLDEPVRNRLLGLLEVHRANELRQLMSYPEGSAGQLMDPRVTAFREGASAAEVLTKLPDLRQRRPLDIFVIDSEGRLVGSLPLQDVVLAGTADRLDSLVKNAPVNVNATATREEIVDLLTQTRLASLPVVDFDGRLIGVIRYDALITAARAEASADIQSMVGASKEERALSKVSFAVKKRLPWLEINLLTAFLAASVVGLFEGTIAKFTALAVLLPVVAGQSGNTGAQALAVTMRGLALREIRTMHWLRVTVKEVNVAFINGVAVAVTTSLAVLVWSGSLGLALVIGISMVISMVAAGLSGAAIPMILHAMGQDPAQSSSIILTTVTDVVGFFSFLGIATMLSSML